MEGKEYENELCGRIQAETGDGRTGSSGDSGRRLGRLRLVRDHERRSGQRACQENAPDA